MAMSESSKKHIAKKRKEAKSKKNHYAVQNSFLMSNPIGSGLQICRVDKSLSGLNRRLYRQNNVYRVKVDVVGAEAQTIDVFRLRDTFMLQRGYQLAMEEWEKSYREAKEVTKDDVIARWRDFRIDVRPHVSDTYSVALNLRASGTGTTTQTVVIDEYEHSLAYQPNGTSMDFGIKSDSDTFDIITEYNKKGKVQHDPQATTYEAAYEELYADLPDEKVARLQQEGNAPPYDADDTQALDVLEYVGTIYIDTDGTSRSSTGYFDAPLGAVYLYGAGAQLTSIDQGETSLFKFTVQKGDYKGVNAEPFVHVDRKE
jgi:hypothetical protein